MPPRSASGDSVYDDYDFGGDDDDDEMEGAGDDNSWTSGERDDHTEALSCIGVRRLCLRDATCRRRLHEFQLYCVENSRIHQCVTTQWFVDADVVFVPRCYAAVQWLTGCLSVTFVYCVETAKDTAIGNRKPYPGFRIVPFSMTLSDPEFNVKVVILFNVN